MCCSTEVSDGDGETLRSSPHLFIFVQQLDVLLLQNILNLLLGNSKMREERGGL
jgi:hypothetical protein